MPKPSTYVVNIDTKLAEKLSNLLSDQGFALTAPQYTLFSAKKSGVSCTLYTSGKLVVQGKEMAEFIEFCLEPFLGDFGFSYPKQEKQPDEANQQAESPEGRIGIDESGKGDFFGPLCIAGVFAKPENIGKLKGMGVKDSKAMSDSAILKLAKSIRAECHHHIVKINPQKYNELYSKFGNLNHLLAWGHATVIEHLVAKTECRNIVVDQFADERVVLTALKRKSLELNVLQRHRAEEDVVVAAASILARETFLLGLEALSREFGIALPKGASAATIKAGKLLVEKHGVEALRQVGKLHFKTYQAII